MHSSQEIEALLNQLENRPAASLEGQHLDFKQWKGRSIDDMAKIVVEMAVCFANGGGGTIVFGVNNKAVGRRSAILGVPDYVDVNRLKSTVYDSTDPKIVPDFQELSVPEGTRRLLIMRITGGAGLYTDSGGTAKIRIGADCQPMTGSMREKLLAGRTDTDPTAAVVPGVWTSLVSPTAMEALRDLAAREKAPREMLQLSDEDLLSNLGCLRQGSLTRAGLLLCGKAEAIREAFPSYVWTYLKMESDTIYGDRHDGREALPVALRLFEDRISPDNPIRTLEIGLVHAEVRAYPTVALREVLLNAMGHADYRLASPILVKKFPGKIEISNPGRFIGGVTPQNILHHPPVARNPALVDALTKLRLVNRSNVGIGRVYEAFLVDGKEPPSVAEAGEVVVVSLLKQEFSPEFRAFVASECKRGRILGVDELLVLQFLTRHAEIETVYAAALCQRPENAMRSTLSRMEGEFQYLERGGTGRGTYWTLHRDLRRRLLAESSAGGVARTDWEAAKTRILSVLRQRARAHEPGLRNSDLRAMTRLDRNQIFRLMRELRKENHQLKLTGHGQGARHHWSDQ
jgi:ATP-dependent DNA helicase RecG